MTTQKPWQIKPSQSAQAPAPAQPWKQPRKGVFEVYAPQLLDNGYSPVAIIPGTKSPAGKGWDRLRTEPYSAQEIEAKVKDRVEYGVGVMGGFGGFVPIDIDTDRDEIIDAVCSVLPQATVAKKGSKGFTGCYRAPPGWEPVGRKFLPAANAAPLVEVLGTGKTVIPPTIHPDLKRPYEWLTEKTLFNTPIGDLPQLTDDFIEALEAALAPWCHKREYTPRIYSLTQRAEVSSDRIEAYARETLKRRADELAGATSGRNNTLFAAVCRVGNWVHHGYLPANEMMEELRSAYTSCGALKEHGRHAFEQSVKSGMRACANDELWIPEGGEPSAPAASLINIEAFVANSIAKKQDGDSSGEDVLEEERAEAFEIYKNKFRTLSEHDPNFPEHLAHVPGLVGGMIDWIVCSARYPSRITALPAALITAGTAMGRQWAGPTESATHLYALLTAPSGVGKDHPLKCVSTLLNGAQLDELVATGRFRSSTSIVNTLIRKALCVSLIDEFGDFLRFIGDYKSGPHAHEIGAMLRELWSNSFDSYRTPEWANRESETIESPSLSVFGVTTPDDFYQSLTERVVGNGLLNRFFAIHLEEKPVEVEPKFKRKDPPAHLTDGLSRLRMPEGFAQGIVTIPGMRGNAIKPRVIPWGAGAEAVYKEMREKVGAMSEEIGTYRVFFGRTCEMALRAATIVAGGVNPAKPVLSADLMAWGRDVMLWSHRDMMERTKLHIAETPTAAAVKRVYRAIHGNGRKAMTKSELTYTLDHALPLRVREEAIKDLIESGKVVEVKIASGKKGGRPSIKYIAREHYKTPKNVAKNG